MKISMTSKQRKVYNEVKPQVQGWELDLHGTTWRDILRLRKLAKAGTTVSLTCPDHLDITAEAVIGTDDPKTLAGFVTSLVDSGYDVIGWAGKEAIHRPGLGERVAEEQKKQAEAKARTEKEKADKAKAAEAKVMDIVTEAPEKPSLTAGLDSLDGTEKVAKKSGKKSA